MTLSVLMPIRAYDPGYLREAVDSLVAQTRPDWRLLCVLDGADPAGVEAALGPRLDDARVELVRSDGAGLAAALNTGMRRAASEFVAVLFGDDLWEPKAVEVVLARVAARPDVDFHHSSQRVVDERGRPLSGVIESRAGVTLADFGPASPVKHLMCWRRELALAAGGMDERLPPVGPDDYDFPWTMAERGARFASIPDCLYVIRDHRSHFRLTTHLPRSVHVRAIRRIQRKHGVGRLATERFLMAARRGYLRQCLYRSRAHRFATERLGLRAPEPWRESYR